MRDILMSIKPYYYYLIGEGIKKIEVRKTFPKSNDWNRQVRLYMSKDEKSFSKIPKEFQEKYRKHFGKVGLEFLCDWIDDFACYSGAHKELSECGSCLSEKEIRDYCNGQTLYGWNISDLKIYDNPKDLQEFEKYYECGNNSCGTCNKCDNDYHITKPPQSWCYTENAGDILNYILCKFRI